MGGKNFFLIHNLNLPSPDIAATRFWNNSRGGGGTGAGQRPRGAGRGRVLALLAPLAHRPRGPARPRRRPPPPARGRRQRAGICPGTSRPGAPPRHGHPASPAPHPPRPWLRSPHLPSPAAMGPVPPGPVPPAFGGDHGAGYSPRVSLPLRCRQRDRPQVPPVRPTPNRLCPAGTPVPARVGTAANGRAGARPPRLTCVPVLAAP